MKKRLAKWFLLVAKRLDPQTHVINDKAIEDYVANKVGLAYVVTKKDIKEFRYKDGGKMSLREGERGIVKEVKSEISKRIFDSIIENGLIEFDTKREDGGFRISGELKVYVPKE